MTTTTTHHLRGSSATAVSLRPWSALTRATKRLTKKHSKRREMKEMAVKIERLRKEMVEIGEDQKTIRDAQLQVRLKFQSLASQCRHLRQETDLILRQSAATTHRLALMFAILRARDNQDFATADNLTATLRELMSDPSKPK